MTSWTPDSVRRAVAARLKPVLQRLPMQPPELLLSALLNRLLLAKLPSNARAALSGRVVAVEVSDLGLVLRLVLDAQGFRRATSSGPPALRIAAEGPAYWRLARGEEDADRLFFERALVMEGDTELGLVLKNTLEAIGPWAVFA